MTHEAVLEANARFYRALSLADLQVMAGVWVHSEAALCIHPGWQPLQGWAAIRASWEQIFMHQGVLRVWASEVQVRHFGQTAEVACLENIDTGLMSGGIVQARASNVFRLVDGAWKMLEHHVMGSGARPAYPLERFSGN